MTEADALKAWMKRRGISAVQLAELTGYGKRSVWWMMRGQTAPNGKHKKPGKIPEWVWQRFKMACGAVEAEIKSGRKFDW